MRARLAANGARSALVERWRGEPARLQELLEEITQDERIMAACACGPDGTPVVETAEYPSQLPCSALFERMRVEGSDPIWGEWTGEEPLPDGDVHLSALPISGDDGLLGYVVLVQDLAFVERREARRAQVPARRLRHPGALDVPGHVDRVADVLARLGATSCAGSCAGGQQRKEFQPILRDVRELVDRLLDQAGRAWNAAAAARRPCSTSSTASGSWSSPTASRTCTSARPDGADPGPAPGQRAGHGARAGDARLLGDLDRARQRAAPTARRSTRAVACACRRARSSLRAAARVALDRGGARLLLRLRQRRPVAAVPHRARAARSSAPRTGSTTARSTRSSPTPCCEEVDSRGPDRPGAGLSLRAGAGDDPRAPAARHGHHVLAHSLAERRALRHLPVARRAARGHARREHPRLPHAVPLQQLPRFGRPLPGGAHRPRAATPWCTAGAATLVRPYPISVEWPVALARRRCPTSPTCRASGVRGARPRPGRAPGRRRRPARLHQGHRGAPAGRRAPARAPAGADRDASPSSSSPRRAGRRSSATASSTTRSRSWPTRINGASARDGWQPDHPAARAPRAADGVPLPSRGRPLLREQPARRHEPGGQGVRRRARRRAGRAGAQRSSPARRAS